MNGAQLSAAPAHSDLVGLWVGYTDGSEPPGWFMELSDDGSAYFFGRTVEPAFRLASGEIVATPTYTLMQTEPLVRQHSDLNNHLTGLFHASKIPEHRRDGFDYSVKSQIEVVLEAHGGAFTLGMEPNAQFFIPDYWTYENGSIAIKGHLFDASIENGILGLYPFRACPYDSSIPGPKLHPTCGNEGLSWKKADKPTFTWKRVTESELIKEYKVFSTLEMMRWSGSGEVRRQSYGVGKRSWMFEDLLGSVANEVDDPIIGQRVLDLAIPYNEPPPRSKRIDKGDRLDAVLKLGFGRWLTTPLVGNSGTLCDLYIGSVLGERPRTLLEARCNDGARVATPTESLASPAMPLGIAPAADTADNVESASQALDIAAEELPLATSTTVDTFESAEPPPQWETVGFWDYDALDGTLIPQGLVLIDAPGSGHDANWQYELQLVKHSELRERNRSLWPVRLNRAERKVCVPFPYPTYSANVTGSGGNSDGVYEFSSCDGN